MTQWTPAQVKEAWDQQLGVNTDMFHRTHPYTCANRGDGNHRAIGSDLGMLIPTINGWICPFCDYTQDWRHE